MNKIYSTYYLIYYSMKDKDQKEPIYTNKAIPQSPAGWLVNMLKKYPDSEIRLIWADEISLIQYSYLVDLL